MKNLYLARHAKSSWDEPDLRDFDRPLNKRGKRDAPFMGKLLKEKGVNPDLIISSPALRALDTAKIFAEELEFSKDNIRTLFEIYDEGVGGILKIINEIEDKYDSIMIFGHNPALTGLCNYLTGGNIDNIPTASVAGMEFDYDSWKYVTEGSGKITLFEYPKKYQKK